MTFDVQKIRGDFAALHQTVHGKSLVYLDNGATTLKPKSVIDATRRCYEQHCANVHRGTHFLSESATREFESARKKVQQFIGAKRVEEIIFTKGTTESINLVAQSFGRLILQAGDEVIVSTMEHHSNIVPWQIICEEKGARLKVMPINDDGEIVFDEYVKLLGPKTKIVAVNHVSNALGTINPVKDIVARAREFGAATVIDGAQATSHLKVNVEDIGCDFYAFSAHKMYGPTGVGVLFGKKDLLEKMPPYQSGGDMIANVTFEKTSYAALPSKFEAGTPNIAGVIGLGAAVDYLNAVGLDKIGEYEQDLLCYATEALQQIEGLRLIGTAKEKATALSFVLGTVHPHDISTILDREGVAIRAGHLCTQPLMKRFGVPALARASIALYNTRDDIDRLVLALKRVKEVF